MGLFNQSKTQRLSECIQSFCQIKFLLRDSN